MKRTLIGFGIGLLLGIAATLLAQTTGAKLWVFKGDQATETLVAGLEKKIAIVEQLGMGREMLAQTDHTTLLAVAVRTGEKPHQHMKSDMFVMSLQGKGEMTVGERTIRMQAGDSAFVPKGTPHYFINKGEGTALALVLFSPPLQPGDSVPVEGNR
jgi:mannose-6-phosphate isomerase-like protein (cupin superfamily)